MKGGEDRVKSEEREKKIDVIECSVCSLLYLWTSLHAVLRGGEEGNWGWREAKHLVYKKKKKKHQI